MSKNQLAKPGASTHAPGLPEGKTLGELHVMEQTQKKNVNRRKIVLPPCLFARPQPALRRLQAIAYRPTDRTGLRQAQTPAAQRRRAQQRGRLAQDRLPPRSVQPQGRRKLPQKLRLWFRLNPFRLSYDFDGSSGRIEPLPVSAKMRAAAVVGSSLAWS